MSDELVRILSAETGFTHEEAAELVQAITELHDGFHEQIDGVINVLMIRYPPSETILDGKETWPGSWQTLTEAF